MNNYLEPLKVESALRSENMKLEYRKNNKPDEINILDYTVIEALEKQVPKETIEKDRVNKFGRCPNCRSIISPFKVKFCSECGQKLQWD